MKTKPRITGIGGIFLRARSPQKPAAWYRRHPGLPVDDASWVRTAKSF